MKLGLYISATVCLCGLLLANTVSHTAIRRTRVEIKQTYQSPKIHLPADMVKLLAGEFKGLAADYLLLEVASFLGSNQKGTLKDYQNIYLALKQTLALDPYFQQTYLYVQGTLPWEAVMPEKAIELLAESAKHRPWDYIPWQYMGFNYYFFFDDYAKASDMFFKGAAIKNAPPIMADLGARFAHRTGRTEAAIILLQDLLKDQKDHLDIYTQKEIEDRLAALKGVWVLDRAVNAFHQRHNAYPDTLIQLVENNFLKRLPANPYKGQQYHYDPQTGKVAFDEVK